MRLAILSNINLDSLRLRLSRSHDVYKTEGYGVWVQEITNAKSGLYSFRPETVFIILDGSELIKGEGVDENNKEIETNIRYIEEAIVCSPDTNFFISNIDFWDKPIRAIKHGITERKLENLWEESLLRLCEKYNNAYIFDLKSLVEDVGRERFYSRKLWYLGGMKLSMKAENLIGISIDRCIDSVKGVKKKCLVLDLDNTLWGGIVGEVGLEGIELSDYKEGARYKDFQKRLKEIKKLGVILAIVSKNNYMDAIKVIREHKHMILKEDDFVDLKINWETKAYNIRKISEELNIGLDSIVFIDDNPVERESIKKELPQVVVPDFPEDTSQLEDFAVQIYNDYFYTLFTTNEDDKKTEIYKQNKRRIEAVKSSGSYEEFLNSLNTEITIWRINEDDIKRASQLTQKTNQFNLTTKRYSEAELFSLLNEEVYDCFIANVKDKFGDNGIVSVIITKRISKSEVELDTFLLSCRVMGRFIEDKIISYIEKIYFELGFKKLITYYIPTDRNLPVKELFERLGYTLVNLDRSGKKKYELSLDKINNLERKDIGKLVIL